MVMGEGSRSRGFPVPYFPVSKSMVPPLLRGFRYWRKGGGTFHLVKLGTATT